MSSPDTSLPLLPIPVMEVFSQPGQPRRLIIIDSYREYVDSTTYELNIFEYLKNTKTVTRTSMLYFNILHPVCESTLLRIKHILIEHYMPDGKIHGKVIQIIRNLREVEWAHCPTY